MDEVDDIPAQLYLITPTSFELLAFSNSLSEVLDGVSIAAVRLRLASENVDDISKAADTLREVCHARDVPIVIEKHVNLVQPLGLDGVHLVDSSRSVRDARKDLDAEAIIGTYCGASKHAGMTAAEIGADYVAFGPTAETPLGTGKPVDFDLFAWWSQMVEVPVVAEGALTLERAKELAQIVDFIALGDEVWSSDSPLAEAKAYFDCLSAD